MDFGFGDFEFSFDVPLFSALLSFGDADVEDKREQQPIIASPQPTPTTDVPHHQPSIKQVQQQETPALTDTTHTENQEQQQVIPQQQQNQEIIDEKPEDKELEQGEVLGETPAIKEIQEAEPVVSCGVSTTTPAEVLEKPVPTEEQQKELTQEKEQPQELKEEPVVVKEPQAEQEPEKPKIEPAEAITPKEPEVIKGTVLQQQDVAPVEPVKQEQAAEPSADQSHKPHSKHHHPKAPHKHSRKDLPVLPPPAIPTAPVDSTPTPSPAAPPVTPNTAVHQTPNKPPPPPPKHTQPPPPKPNQLLLRKSSSSSVTAVKPTGDAEQAVPHVETPQVESPSQPADADQSGSHHPPPSVKPPPPPPKMPHPEEDSSAPLNTLRPAPPSKPMPPPPPKAVPPPPPSKPTPPPPPSAAHPPKVTPTQPLPSPPETPDLTTPAASPTPSPSQSPAVTAEEPPAIGTPSSSVTSTETASTSETSSTTSTTSPETASRAPPTTSTPSPTPTPKASALAAFNALPPSRPALGRGLNRTSSLAAFKKPGTVGAASVFQNEGGLVPSTHAAQVRVPRKAVPRMTPIVVDTGSSYVKGGVAGEDIPRCLVPTIVGYEDDYIFVGPNALKKDKLKVTCPVDPRSDVDWEGIGEIWEHTFLEELGIDPTAHPMLLTELPNMSAKSREEMTDVFFNNLCVPALHIANPAVLSLYSLGLFTGLVVDCGNRLQIVPVIDGHVIEEAVYKLKRGVAGLTEHMARLLTRKGYFFNMASAMQTDTVRKLKESVCYVALEPEKELARKEREILMNYTLPDGKVVTVGQERFLCPEVLFKPNDIGLDVPGIHTSLCDCVNRCPIDYRKELLSHIVLVGGSTLFQGFEERLEKEVFVGINKGNLRRRNVKCIAPHNRKYLAWFGGSVLAKMPDFVSSTAIWADEEIKRQYT
ncbi:actin subfamily protein [Pelomyxa schiedti]|nr:actin subfamily protein [Pelomyxa schiedti]